MSAINEMIEAVIALMNATQPFARVTRGALPTGVGLTCEIAPGMNESVFMDKKRACSLGLVINGKHHNMKTLSDAMNKIHSALTMATEYPQGESWQITDILNSTIPAIIGREQNNEWLMASQLQIRFFWKGE